MYQSHSSTNHKNKQETKEENSAVADLRCTGNSMEVSAHINNMQPTTKIINKNFLMDR